MAASLRSWALAPKLHRACLSVMAWSLPNARHAEVRDQFLALDKNHNGSISLEELKKAMMVGSDPTANSDICKVFDLLPEEHHSEMHYSDFLAAMLCSHIALDDSLIRSTFQRFDRHHSGCVGSAELKAMLGSCYEGVDVDTLLIEAGASEELGAKLSESQFAEHLSTSRSALIAQQNSLRFDLGSGPVLLGRQGMSSPCIEKQAERQDIPDLLVADPSRSKIHIEAHAHHKQPACCIVQ